MGKLVTTILALVLLATPILAQPVPTGVIGDTVRPVATPILDTVVPAGENATGEDLHSEDLAVAVDLAVNNVEYQLFGILFGGGKVQADIIADARLEFRAVSMERLDEALRAMTGDANITVNGTFGIPPDRAALTAEEVRAVGSGLLLQAFQGYAEIFAVELIEGLVPGLAVEDVRASWQNTVPGAWAYDLAVPSDPENFVDTLQIPSIREPPIILDVTIRLQFLQRYSVYEIVEDMMPNGSNEGLSGDTQETPEEPENDTKDPRKAALQANESIPFGERTAFQVLGYSQLLAFEIPPGLALDVTLTVPKGFSIEEVTSEIARSSDHLSATFSLDGRDSTEDAELAALVSITSRATVGTAVITVLLLTGVVLRVVTELLISASYGYMHKRRGRGSGIAFEGQLDPEHKRKRRLFYRRKKAKAESK